MKSNNCMRHLVDSKESLFDFLNEDNPHIGKPPSLKQKIVSHFVQDPTVLLKKYLYYLRKEEYYINTAHGNKIKGAMGLIYDRKKNILGNKLGIEIGPNCFGKGLIIYHIGSIVVNPAATIGDNCKLHGANCIGNNGKTNAVPRIGNNVDIGFGAVIIGDVEIADDVVIGANAVVNKSILVPGSVVVGVPGRIKE